MSYGDIKRRISQNSCFNNSIFCLNAMHQVKIEDVNDNCPELEQTVFNIWANPSLQREPIVKLNASDIDSGNNSLLHFNISEITAT